MKSIIESLFAGILESSNLTSKQKKVLSDNGSDNSENFLSDLNSFLLGEENNMQTELKSEPEEKKIKKK